MESVHELLLLWRAITGLCLPYVLLVRGMPGVLGVAVLTSVSSMRYSRMLEESSFANRKADYVWLLIQSAVMLLVRHLPFIY